MQKFILFTTITFIAVWLMLPATSTAQSAEEPAVQAVLFYSTTCPHCHNVIDNLLLPMLDEYGDQVQIMAIDVGKPEGSMMYDFAVERYKIPPERLGVPTLIVGDTVLVGSGEIPEQFPGIVSQALAADGITWPEFVTPSETTTEASETETAEQSESDVATAATVEESEVAAEDVASTKQPSGPTPSDLAAIEAAPPPIDPVGTTLAGVIMGGMAVTLAFAVWRLKAAWKNIASWFKLNRKPLLRANTSLILALVLLGLGVAGYLAYVEITHVEAVCGPIGDCNTVQTSPYAQLFGTPIAVLGILSYLSIGILWLTQKFSKGKVANLAILGLVVLTVFGVLFSIYLTALEIFVIKAVCMWCISSAIITTLLMLIIVGAVTSSPRMISRVAEAE